LRDTIQQWDETLLLISAASKLLSSFASCHKGPREVEEFWRNPKR